MNPCTSLYLHLIHRRHNFGCGIFRPMQSQNISPSVRDIASYMSKKWRLAFSYTTLSLAQKPHLDSSRACSVTRRQARCNKNDKMTPRGMASSGLRTSRENSFMCIKCTSLTSSTPPEKHPWITASVTLRWHLSRSRKRLESPPIIFEAAKSQRARLFLFEGFWF